MHKKIHWNPVTWIKFKRNCWRVIKLSSCILVLSFIIVQGTHLWQKYSPWVKNNIIQGYQLAHEIKTPLFKERKPTIIYDRAGKVIRVLQQTENTAHYTTLKHYPPLLKKGLIAVEDKRFYQHHGVDPFGTVRALWALRTGHLQGGSTLTQQLVKNVVLKDNSVTTSRKLKEMVIAQELEKRYSKDQILEFYLNNLLFNHGNYGMTAAAHYYFGCAPKDLNAAQIATLIGLINNPAVYDPTNHPQLIKQKRNVILKVFYQQKLISHSTYQQARQSGLQLKITPTKIDNDISNDYGLSYAIHDATLDLMQASGFHFAYWWSSAADKTAYQTNFNRAYAEAQQQLLHGGYSIQTQISPVDQNELQYITNTVMEPYQNRGANGKLDPQVSISVINNATGQLVANQGGRTPQGDQVNRSFFGYHQPGSTAKMLIVYPEAFDRGYTPQAEMTDMPIPNGPHNWYNGYWGKMSIRNAIKDSVNTVAYQLATQVDPSTYITKLTQMQFDNLAPSDYNPIISIGGFTNGVTTTQMASGYSALSRQGKFIAPSLVTNITNEYNQQTIWSPDQTPLPLFSPEAAYMSLDSMKTVVQEGSGKAAMLSNYPYVAGKTGTTDSNQDSYFVGLTPYYTIAVWVGHDQAAPLTEAQLNLSMTLFKQVGEYFNKNQPVKDFPKPDSITQQGNNLTVAAQKKTPDVSQVITTAVLQTQSRDQHANQVRRDRLAYRIIYHVSLKEEKRREQLVRQTLKAININDFTKLSQYEKFVKKLQRAQEYNLNVRRREYQTRFSQEIIQKQTDLQAQQAELTVLEAEAKKSAFAKRKQQAQAQVDRKKQQMIANLESQLDAQKQKVITAYQNNDPQRVQEKNKLVDLINQLRALGADSPDLNLEVVVK